jgi:hypothetical protein
MDLNAKTITSNYYEVFLSSITLPLTVTPELRTLSLTNPLLHFTQLSSSGTSELIWK